MTRIGSPDFKKSDDVQTTTASLLYFNLLQVPGTAGSNQTFLGEQPDTATAANRLTKMSERDDFPRPFFF